MRCNSACDCRSIYCCNFIFDADRAFNNLRLCSKVAVSKFYVISINNLLGRCLNLNRNYGCALCYNVRRIVCTNLSRCANRIVIRPYVRCFTVSVTERGNFFLSYKCNATNGALLTLGKTCFGTGCILACYYFLGMTERRDFFLCYECFATNGALLTVLKTCIGTGCCLTGNYLLGMRKLGNNLVLSANLITANRALNYEIVGTFSCTGCLNSVFFLCFSLYVIGAKLCFTNVALEVTAFVLVSKSVDTLLSKKGLATNRASHRARCPSQPPCPPDQR